MSFANSQYSFKDIVKSASLELNSNISGKFSNQLIASYTNIQATRSTPSTIFPFIDIIGDATKSGAAATYAGGARFNYMSAGYETFSYNNDVQNKILISPITLPIMQEATRSQQVRLMNTRP
jgi:hypothetical protein